MNCVVSAMYNENYATIVGKNGTILRTTNGGSDWISQISGTSNSLYGVSFADTNIGFAVGYNGTIINTTNGGENWLLQSSGTESWLYSISIISVSNATAVGSFGTILHTTNGGVTFIEDENNFTQPKEFLLQQNYPNPFNPSTKISWQSPVSSWQTLKVYDILGNEVATLVNEYRNAGNYEIEFNPASSIKNWHRNLFLPAKSWRSLQAQESFVETKKMILLK